MSRTVSLSTAQMAAVLAVVLAISGIGAVVLADVAPTDRPESDTTTGPEEPAVSTFDSAEEFRSYLRSADRPHRSFGARNAAASRGDEVSVDAADGDAAQESAPSDDQVDAPQSTAVEEAGGERRASDTNVQIGSVDEPDVLKTTPQIGRAHV